MSSTQPADVPFGEPIPGGPADAAADRDLLARYREELRAAVAGDRPASLPLRLGAEALGTFALVLVAVGVGLYGQFRSQDLLAPALAAGLVLAGTTAALGRVSGGHFNPLVTLGATIGGRFSWADLPLYWISQLVGGALAVGTVFLTIPSGFTAAIGDAGGRSFMSTMAKGWGDRSPLATLTQGQVTADLTTVLVLELVAAAVLVAVFLGSTSPRATRGAAPAAIGLTYTALFLLLAQVSGGGVNPARSTAVAIFAEGGALGQLWPFWVAPLVGAAIAGLAYLAFATPSVDEDLAALALAEDHLDDDLDLPGDGDGDEDGTEEHIVVEPR